MTPVELRVFYWLIGFFNIVLLIFIVSTVIIFKKAEVGTGMSLENDIYCCKYCGSKVESETLGDGLLFYCPKCSPVQYCEKTGRPYKDKCDCVNCN